MEYLDFELEVTHGAGDGYVVVARSPNGGTRETAHFPFSESELQNRLLSLENAILHSIVKGRKVLSNEEQIVKDFGEKLFDALFPGKVRYLYYTNRNEANRQGKGLRLKLRILTPELAALPLEFLYDSYSSKFLSLDCKTPIVRYPELPMPIQRLTITPPLRILGMAASPTDLPPLDIEREKKIVEDAVKDLQAHGLVEMTWPEGQTWHDLQMKILKGPWHIFHFIGHGGFDSEMDEGYISLANKEKKESRLRATDLNLLLADHPSMRLVILNSCMGAKGSKRDIFSSIAAILVHQGIPAVLAMQHSITDTTAIKFISMFYEALTSGWPVDAAVAQARKEIHMETLEWGTPVLYMYSTDGALFSLSQRPDAGRKPQIVPTTPTILKGHTKAVNSVAFSPDGKMLASGSDDKSVRLWRISDGEVLHWLNQNVEVPSVAFSPNGEFVATGSMGKSVRLWRVSNGELLRKLEGHTKAVNSVAFSPDGKMLASGSDDNTIRLWQVE